MDYKNKTLIRGESLYIKVKLYSENSVTGKLEPYDAQELTNILESTKNGELPLMVSEARLSDGKRIPLTIIQELDDGVAVDGELSLYSDVETWDFPGESFDVNIILKKQMDLGFRDGNDDVVMKDVKSATFNETFYLARSASRLDGTRVEVEPTPTPTPTPGPAPEASEGLLFEDIDENTCRCIGRGNCVDAMLVIPSTHEGKTVTQVGRPALAAFNQSLFGNFEGDSLISLYLPDTITLIGYRCFCECHGLNSIRFPQNSEFHVMTFAFYDTGIEVLTVPANMKAGDVYYTRGVGGEIASRTEYGSSIFSHCRYLTKVILEEGFNFGRVRDSEGNVVSASGVSITGSSMFSNCDNLSEVSIPQSVNLIPEYLFNNCESLTEIRFTAPVINDMEERVFSGKQYISGQTPTMTHVYFDCKNAPGVRYRVGESGSPVTFYYDGTGIGWAAFKTNMERLSTTWGANITWVDISQQEGDNA